MSNEDNSDSVLRNRGSGQRENVANKRNEDDAGDGKMLTEPIPSGTDEIDSDGDDRVKFEVDEPASRAIPQDKDNMFTKTLESVLHFLPSRWVNWVIRGLFTWLMIGGFALIIYGGPLALMLLTLVVQVKCFSEIINIGYTVYKVHNLPWFRSLSWYFLIASNYFFYGESLVDYFGVLVNSTEFLPVLVRYHRFISFFMYVIGFVWFVLSLVKRYYMRQFSLFAWTHVALFIVVTQSYFILQNLFEGLIWFIMPVMMIVVNDVMAYMFGFFMGKTPLIKLSPKKTWEGYIGGGVSTVFLSLLAAYVMCPHLYFICPIEYNEELGHMTHDSCEPSIDFIPFEHTFTNPLITTLLKMVGQNPSIWLYPFHLHAFSMSMFASLIGPFGGFFASGFKRAFKIKDFGDIIPGHGGIMDRFDCQFIMATFVNVYIYSFIRRSLSPQKLMQQIFMLKTEEQLSLYYNLQDSLTQRGILLP